MFEWEKLTALSEAVGPAIWGKRGILQGVDDPKELFVQRESTPTGFMARVKKASTSNQSTVLAFNDTLEVDGEDASDLEQDYLEGWLEMEEVVVVVLVDQSGENPEVYYITA